MQLAGQTVGHRPHATHLGRPSSCVSITCVPRHRGDRGFFSSGYWMVTSLRSPADFTMCRKVSAIPFSEARR
jgi:hypothetical protein